MAKKTTEPVVETNRIVEILKAMETKGHKGDLMWMKGDGVVADVPVTSSGILSLDLALGCGGYPHGRIIEIYGPESAGKTSVTLHAVAEFQKRGGVAAFVDAENSLDTSYSERLGVDVGNLLINQPDNGEQAWDMVIKLAQTLTHGDIIVIDSVAALVPQIELEGEVGDAHVGLQARMMSQGLRMLSKDASRSGVVVFFTNQLRQKIGVTWGSNETTCVHPSTKVELALD